MKQLQEYRSKLVERMESVVDEFGTACLSVENPFKATDEGGWNTHQLAAHTRAVDKLVYGLRARQTATENNPVFQNFDGEAWMSTRYNPDEPLTSILDELAASVKETASILRALPPKAWNRESSHEIYGGGFSLQTWVERGLAHILEHLETVKKAS